MTRINDYLWHLPHLPEADDPQDVTTLQQMFNHPLVDLLEEPLGEQGYTLSANDIHVPPDKIVTMAEMANTYRANVRFVKYLSDHIIARVHFEHDEWALRLPESDQHIYTITLDRYRVLDRQTMTVDPQWDGRKRTLVSSNEGSQLHYTGRDQLWIYASGEQLAEQLQRFLRKFIPQGAAWLEADV